MDSIELEDIIFKDYLYRGNFSDVWKIEQKSNRRELCMKRVHVFSIKDLQKKSVECLTMVRVQHPHMVKLISTLVEGDNKEIKYLDLFMEYYPEGDLAKLIESRIEINQFWTENEVLEYLFQLVSALEYLENLKISHRDIKPKNILVSNKKLILGDFGSSRRVMIGDNLSIAGTTLYASPLLRRAILRDLKNLSNHHNPFKSDVYSLGLTILYMVTLKDPSDLTNLDTLPEILEKRIREIPKQYPRIKLLTQAMLTIDETTRPNFSELLEMVEIQKNSAQCDGCEIVKVNSELKSKDSENMCNECRFKVNFIPDCQM